MDRSEAEDAVEVFDRHARIWDHIYSADRPSARSFEYRQRRDLALDLVRRHAPTPAEVLDVGCGAGHITAALAGAGYQVTGLDPSPEMLSRAARTLSRAGVKARLIQGKLGRASVPGADVVLAVGVLGYLPDGEQGLTALSRLVRPGGVLIVSCSNRASPASWLEAPVKRRLSRLGPLARLSVRLERVADLGALSSASSFDAGQVERCLGQQGLVHVETRYGGFGFRFGSRWIPPLFVVRRAEKLSQTPLRPLGRTFFVVGRRPW